MSLTAPTTSQPLDQVRFFLESFAFILRGELTRTRKGELHSDYNVKFWLRRDVDTADHLILNVNLLDFPRALGTVALVTHVVERFDIATSEQPAVDEDGKVIPMPPAPVEKIENAVSVLKAELKATRKLLRQRKAEIELAAASRGLAAIPDSDKPALLAAMNQRSAQPAGKESK